MKPIHGRVFHFLLFALLIISSCDSSSSPNEEAEIVINEGLIGGWKGTYFEYTHQNAPFQSVDLALYGVSHTMIVSEDSIYTANTSFLGQESIEIGSISIHNNEFTFTPQNDSSRTGIFTMDSLKLHIQIDDDHFDFDQDGIDEPATLIVDLEKVSN